MGFFGPQAAEAYKILEEHISGVLDDQYSKRQRKVFGLRLFTIKCIAVCTLTSILLGYDIGIWGAAKRAVKEHFSLSDHQVEVLIGMLNIIAAFGGLISGKLSDRFGRRLAIAMACVLFIVGSFFKCLAQSYASLIVGRVLTGIGVSSKNRSRVCSYLYFDDTSLRHAGVV